MMDRKEIILKGKQAIDKFSEGINGEKWLTRDNFGGK